MGQLVNRPGAPTLSSFVFLDTMGLLNVCKPFMETARHARRGVAVEHGPSDLHVDAAVQTVEEELSTPEFLEALQLEETLPLPEEESELMQYLQFMRTRK